MGGFMDGLALTLTSSVHLRDGHFLEASWDNYFYTRQWNVPPEFEVHRHAVEATSPAVPASPGSPPRRCGRVRLRAGDRHAADAVPDQPRHPLASSPSRSSRRSRRRRPTA